VRTVIPEQALKQFVEALKLNTIKDFFKARISLRFTSLFLNKFKKTF
jgi:hypothetical protein